MTVLIGFSFPDLTVLGADTRGTADHDPTDVADDMQKIYRTGFGLMAGAGRSDIIEAVTRRFAGSAPASNAEASEIVREEINKLGLPPDDVALLKTCWLAGFSTKTEEGPQARLAVVSSSRDYDFGVWPDHDFLIIKPAGLSDDLSRSLEREGRRRFEEHIRNAASEQRLMLCVRMIASLVKTLVQLSGSVSGFWQVGYLDAPANIVRISSISQDPNALEWR